MSPPSSASAAAARAASTNSGAEYEVIFLGSGACFPSPARGASCTALRVRDSYWLFDVGEGTQVQLQRCWVRPSRIDKIFITHAHGDHAFGLPGLLCLIANGRDKGAPPLEIYGPHGLRAFIRVALSFTGTRMVPAYVVHELHGVPQLKQVGNRALPQPISSRPVERPNVDGRGNVWGETCGSCDLSPTAGDADRTVMWKLFENEELSVTAAPVEHTVPCVGYIVHEHDKEGRLLVERALPKLEANRAALREEWGVRDPRSLLKKVKLLGPDEVMELPDGDALRGSEVIGERRRGRKLIVLGDCCDASPCVPLARGADLVIHEATNAYLPSLGDHGGASRLERETHRRGHSTPEMAGAFARRVGAKALVLTHFSQRYHPASFRVMQQISRQAAEAAALPPDCVAPAYDTLAVPLWAPDRNQPALPPEAHAPPPRHALQHAHEPVDDEALEKWTAEYSSDYKELT